jgi:GNAT superfamily N-acetyltransferase
MATRLSGPAPSSAEPGLREATDDDAWGLIALITACWAEYPGCVVDIAGEFPELQAPGRHFRERNATLWVIPDGAWIGACVGLVPGDGKAELVKLYVAPHLRGQGLGASLVRRVERAAAEGGCHEIELWSDTRFLPAHRLYHRLGYTRTGATRELHDLSRSVEYQFRKDL